jgi:hypothetical protein
MPAHEQAKRVLPPLIINNRFRRQWAPRLLATSAISAKKWSFQPGITSKGQVSFNKLQEAEKRFSILIPFTFDRSLCAHLHKEFSRILEKQNSLQTSQVFSVCLHWSFGGFAFQGFYKRDRET